MLLNLFNVLHLGQELDVVLLVVLQPLLGKELFAHVSSLVELFGSQLHVNKVCFLQYLVHFVHLLALQFVDVSAHLIEEVVDGVPDGVAQVELLAVGDEDPVLNHAVELLVDVLDEVLGCGLQQENLVVVVSVVRQVAALLADQLIVNNAESHVRLLVINTLHLLTGRVAARSSLLV